MKVSQTIDLGTHLMFIGEVTEKACLSDVPSATYDYYQSHIKPQPKSDKGNGHTVWRCRICGYEYEGDELRLISNVRYACTRPLISKR